MLSSKMITQQFTALILEFMMGNLLLGQWGLMVARAGCPEQLATCGRHLGFTPSQFVAELVPNIEDSQKTAFCKSFHTTQQCYMDAKAQKCEGTDVQLAAIAGYDYICSFGQGSTQYSKHRECLQQATAKLGGCTTRSMASLGAIHTEGLISNPEKHTQVCSDINAYLTCSRKEVIEVCKDEVPAGDWYVAYITYPFQVITNNRIACSLGQTQTKEGFSIATIAIIVGVCVAVLIILICICWCCRAGVCSCCRESETDFDDFPDDNDNKKAVLTKKDSSVV